MHGFAPLQQPTHATLPDDSFLISSMQSLSSLIVSEVVCCLCSNCCEAGAAERDLRVAGGGRSLAADRACGSRRLREPVWRAP